LDVASTYFEAGFTGVSTYHAPMMTWTIVAKYRKHGTYSRTLVVVKWVTCHSFDSVRRFFSG